MMHWDWLGLPPLRFLQLPSRHMLLSIDSPCTSYTSQPMTSALPYDEKFFARQSAGSLRSAKQLLPHIFKLTALSSVIDVGCGVGTWLSVCWDHGITDILGIDGHWVDPQALRIPQKCFQSADLTKPFPLKRTFDLALSLEVAEHLPPEAAETYVDTVARASPIILFSAAIPGQGGTDHQNEQWPEYWLNRFNKKGFVAFDILRKDVWNDEAIDWCYRQNILLLVSEEHLQSHPALHHALEKERLHTNILPLVHPLKLLEALNQNSNLQNSCNTFQSQLQDTRATLENERKKAVVLRENLQKEAVILRESLQHARANIIRLTAEKTALRLNLHSILSSQTYRCAVKARDRLRRIPVLYPLARSALRTFFPH